MATDKTLAELAPVEMPEYKLINTSNGEGKLSSHIKSAVFNNHAGSTMVDSPLDDAETRSALGLFDNNFASYVECEMCSLYSEHCRLSGQRQGYYGGAG